MAEIPFPQVMKRGNGEHRDDKIRQNIINKDKKLIYTINCG